MTDQDAVDWRELNRANWDGRVPVHLASEFYDVDGFRSGVSSLRPFESAGVGDVSGNRLVHLQCHLGVDTPLNCVVERYPLPATPGWRCELRHGVYVDEGARGTGVACSC